MKSHAQAEKRMSRLWKKAAQQLDGYQKSTEIPTSKNTTLSNCPPQFNPGNVEANGFEEPSQPRTLPSAYGNPSSEPSQLHHGPSCSAGDSMTEPLRQELVRAPLLASYTITEPSHLNPHGQASCPDEHTMAENSHPNSVTRAPLLTTHTITEHPYPTGQASYLDEHTMVGTQHLNPLARAPLLSTYTITEPSNPTGQASYLDEHTVMGIQYPNPPARAPLLSTYTITEPSNPNPLSNAPLSDSFFTTSPVHMHQSAAAFIRSGNMFPSAFAADDIQAGFS